MGTKIYECKTCRRGYAFIKSEPKGMKCTSCDNGELIPAEDREQSHCEKCNSVTDVATLIMHGNLGRIPEGPIKCKYDETHLRFQ